MIHSELIQSTTLNDKFHSIAQQLNGVNTASIVQDSKKPKGKMAYILSYFKAFINAKADTSDVKSLFGMLHFGMISIGSEIDMAEVTGWPHGLRCLQGPPGRTGAVGIIITGDGDQWANAISGAGTGPESVQEWGMSCYRQFAMRDLAELIGTIKPKKGKNTGYFLDFT